MEVYFFIEGGLPFTIPNLIFLRFAKKVGGNVIVMNHISAIISINDKYKLYDHSETTLAEKFEFPIILHS